ncbi:polyprenyl synthetase family protein [Fructilactobacillus sanfranciscensis]|nr:polyprenyl synthetase family protein [Fructilactobacillus sanfranciscensis]RDX59469.1 polyprenyl synthetase family protein [Fructilactobacillus sanfranciscensis]
MLMKFNQEKLNRFQTEYIPKIDAVLSKEIKNSSNENLLVNSMQYSLMAGGKRLRPLLVLAVLESYGVKITDELIKISCAVELLHTYSLIHDDLPEMDNSDYRRGKLANHKKFGDDIAVLAGDGLLTLAFSWLSDNSLPASQRIKLVSLLSNAAGPKGMVEGQVIDVTSAEKTLDLVGLQTLDRKKTGELFHYCILAGSVLAKVDEADQQSLLEFAWNFGIAFQIYDDILDAPTDETQEDIDKNTYVNFLGMQGAKTKLSETVENCIKELEKLENAQSIDLLKSFLSYFQFGKG